MNKLIIALALGCIALAGCSSDAEIAAIEAKVKNPPITKVGVFEGCEVSFVDRHYQSQSFYMAKCPGSAVTVTNNYTEQSGKTQIARTRTSITQEIASLQKELADVSQAELKERALKKLTPDELAALKAN